MKKQPNIIPTKFLPRGSRRITNAENERVWLINGVEYASKAEYFQHLADLRLAKSIRTMPARKPVPAVTDDSPLCPECKHELHLFTDGKHVCRNEACPKYDHEFSVEVPS
jgi:hypothetical protein